MEMKVVGSVIARIGSKRLTYKNLLPTKVNLWSCGQFETLDCRGVHEVVLSTDSELIARTCMEEDVRILWRPEHLAR